MTTTSDGTPEIDDWFAAAPTLADLPRSDQLRIWAGMKAKTLPEPLAREVQLTSFHTTLRVFTVLAILAAVATITIIATLVPLEKPEAQVWTIVHASAFLGLLLTILWLRPKLADGTLTLSQLNFSLMPNVVLAALLWGTLPIAVGDTNIGTLYLAIAVAAIFGAIGFFWAFGDWPVSFVYGFVIAVAEILSFARFNPGDTPVFAFLWLLMLVALTTMSLLAARGLSQATFDAVVARDRQQFIDLLLRDHERGGLDFLWETDDDLILGPVPARMVSAARGDPRVQQGRSLLELIDDASVLDLIEKRRAFNTNISTAGPDGRGQLRLSGRPKPIGGTRVGYRGIGSDAATARRAAEAERIRERLDTMVALTGGLAHDFNNQLATVLGAVELAQLDPGISDQSSTLLGHAAEACLRTRRITSDLVVASGHSTTYDAVPFRLTETVEQVIADVRPLYASVTIELRSNASVWVEADKTQFMRALRNLIENGCQAVLGENRTGVDQSIVSVSVDEDDTEDSGFAVTTVSDTGPGIDVAHSDVIFEPFFTTRREVGGTGLGLSIARGFAHQANGSLQVMNHEVGAEFRLRIPSIPHPADPELAPDDHDDRDFTPTIDGLALIVEDDPNVAHNLRQLLESFGAEVAVAGSVGDAISGFGDRVTDLACVISDIILPDGEGYEVIAAFRRAEPNLKAVYMSGFTRTLPSSVAPELRCPFLPKPFSTAEFVGSLRSAGIGGS